jgi:hypothetical protein
MRNFCLQRKFKLLSALILAITLLTYGCGEKKNNAMRYPDEIVLSNGIVKLGVSPAVGRIVSFSKVGGKDLLWRNLETNVNAQKQSSDQWVNYGGDKIWPTLEYSWPRIYGRSNAWPPDKNIDGEKWRLIKQTKTRIVIESPESTHLHVRIRREISLETGKAAISIKNTIKRLSASPFPVCIWSVTQVKPPEYCLLGIEEKRPCVEPFVDFYNIRAKADARLLLGETELKLIPQNGKFTKVGTFGRWIAAVYPDCIFHQSTEYDPSACYPDNASVECYWDSRASNPNKQSRTPNYVELELLGASTHLQPGEQISSTVSWKIINRPDGSDHKLITKLCSKEVSL